MQFNPTDFRQELSGKNINFLFGSGASAPLYPTLSMGEKCRSFEDILSDPNYANVNSILYCFYFYHWIYPMVEDLLAQDQNEEKMRVFKNYEKFMSLLCDHLERESNERPKRANIFTTNYDLNFEHAFEKISKERTVFLNDGALGFINRILSTSNYNLSVQHTGYTDHYKREIPCINLMKLHGSLSWHQRDQEIMVNYNVHDHNLVKKALGSDNGKIGLYFKYAEKFLKPLEDKIKSKDFEEKLLLDYLKCILTQSNGEKWEEFAENFKKIPIINPDKWKFHDTVFEQHYYQVIRTFSYEMEKPNTILIVMGFSFADEHLLEIFKRSLSNPSLKVYVIPYSKHAQECIQSKLGNRINVFYLPDFTKCDTNSFHEDLKGDFTFLNCLLGGK